MEHPHDVFCRCEADWWVLRNNWLSPGKLTGPFAMRTAQAVCNATTMKFVTLVNNTKMNTAIPVSNVISTTTTASWSTTSTRDHFSSKANKYPVQWEVPNQIRFIKEEPGLGDGFVFMGEDNEPC